MVCSCVKINVNAVELLSFVPSLLGNGFRYLAGLGKSGTDILADEANRLKAIRDDIEEAASAQESIQCRQIKQQVEQWMKEVDDLLNEVNKFKASRIYGIPCLRDCPCWATDMLERVGKLKIEGKDLKDPKDPKDLLGEEPLRRTNEVPNPRIVGGNATLTAVHRLLGNSDVKVIGIYGLPGIGKTTLLQKIYHELRNHNQRGGGGHPIRVIYAKVSKEPNILNLQKDIFQELGLPVVEDGPSDASYRESQQAKTLFRKLSNKNIILLLDDVWEPLKWDKIGIPSPDVDEAACKIIFTTPFQQVCKDMGAGAGGIKVGFLSDEESWKLFCQKVQRDENDSTIAQAKPVVNGCGGLPRAVITISKHMACSALNRECEEMVKKLKHSPHEISDMKDMVLFPLKCIFDKLDERAVKMRQCLLYCSLFPEDQNIYIDQLIDYWVGEGFLDAECYVHLPTARDRGRDIIRTLMNECFLESTHEDDHKEVKLHDVVRGMALWLTDGDQSGQSRLFLTSNRLKDSTNLRWEKAERISSMDNCVKVFPSTKINCPHLLTFLFNNHSIHLNHRNRDTASTHHELCNVRGDPRNFFKFAPALKVLDLSGTQIDELPAEIGYLHELQYLNVSYTNISYVPEELSKLEKLRQLKLRGTPHLSSIPNKSIPPQTILQMFDLFGSSYCWTTSTIMRVLKRQINLADFSTWNFLNEIGLTITDSAPLVTLCSSEKLSRSTVFLKLQDVEELRMDHLSSVFTIMKNLRELSISGTNLPNLEVSTAIEVIERPLHESPLHESLRHLHISNWPGLTHITWVHRLPSLVEIELSNCRGVEELVAENHCSLPRKLREIHLTDLPSLTRIACRRLSSPSLKIISVTECPVFKGLSFDAETAANINKIRGERRWWDGLQWDENDGTKSILISRFTEAGGDTGPKAQIQSLPEVQKFKLETFNNFCNFL